MSNINDENDASKSSQTNDYFFDPLTKEERRKLKIEQRQWSRDYMHLYQLNRLKLPYSNIVNAKICIDNDFKFKGLYKYDKMKRLITLWYGKPRTMEDADITAAQEYMGDFCCLLNLSKEMVYGAISLKAHEDSIHPLQDYIVSLQWDNTPRLDRWLVSAIGCEDNEYNNLVGRWWLIQAVARAMSPGCKADYMLILEGPQGELKSTVFKIIGGDWFSDALPDIHTKDASIHATTKWVIEVGELHALNKADVFHFKTWMTRQVERYRPPYGRVEEEVPRCCVLGGTTNEDTYLKDPSGGRRFWPVKCGKIDLQWLIENKNQLIAEAWYHYSSQEPWWPPREFEEQYIKPEQEKRRETDPWISPMVNNIKAVVDRKKTTIVELFQIVLAQGIGKLPNTADSRRIADILRGLGAVMTHTKRGNFWDVSGI